jgi:hypothetical protein
MSFVKKRNHSQSIYLGVLKTRFCNNGDDGRRGPVQRLSLLLSRDEWAALRPDRNGYGWTNADGPWMPAVVALKRCAQAPVAHR